MQKIIISGCSGHMGRVVESLCAADPQVQVAAGFDILGSSDRDFPVFSSPAQFSGEADAVIDFSSPAALEGLLDFARATGTPLVLATTGYTPEQVAQIGAAALEVPIFRSANMSLGVNTLLKLLQDAAKVLAPAGFDMEIVEKHHKHKLDAPSGTAIAMADSINEAMGNEYTYTYDRSGRRQERDPKEIGISAVRGGNIVGEHEVIFAGLDEVIEFKHTAYSKAVFAKGAVSAAKFLKGKGPGYYDMSDVIEANA